MRDLTIAASVVRALMELAVSKGANRNKLAERAGIDLADLRDRDNRLPFGKYVTLMKACQESCNDPAFALHFGEEVDPLETGLSHSLGGAATIEEAFAQTNRYAPLSVEVDADGTGDRFQLRRIAGQTWIVDARRNPDSFPELTESTFATIACSTRRMLGGVHAFKEVHVTHAAPAYSAEYERVFHAPVVFESDRNGLRIDESVLAAFRPPPSPRYASAVLREHAETLLAKLDSERSIRRVVERLLTPGLRMGKFSMGSVAGELGLSRQTLFRRLKTEGVTFEQVLDELRHALALHHLNAGKASVKETAGLVGYSDPAAFSRAFKRWTGASPRGILHPRRPGC